MNLLINLPPDFFTQPELLPVFRDLEKKYTLRKTSHNTAEEIAEDLAWADAVIMWSWPVLDEELLEKAGKLVYAGHIDVGQKGAKAELACGLPVSCSRSGFSPAVAEMALGLILNCLRRISDYHSAMRSGTETWVEAFPKDINPSERELAGSKVGLIGLGQVGQRLATFLQPFETQLLIADPYVKDAQVQKFQGSRVDLDTLIQESDIVVLCAASNDGTSKLIDRTRIERFRKDAVFINVARAALVDTDALVDRLQKKDLIAAIDVFDKEPLSGKHPLRSLPNAYLTPHRAGGLIRSVQRNIEWLVEDLDRVMKGETQKHPLTESMIPGLDS